MLCLWSDEKTRRVQKTRIIPKCYSIRRNEKNKHSGHYIWKPNLSVQKVTFGRFEDHVFRFSLPPPDLSLLPRHVIRFRAIHLYVFGNTVCFALSKEIAMYPIFMRFERIANWAGASGVTRRGARQQILVMFNCSNVFLLAIETS